MKASFQNDDQHFLSLLRRWLGGDFRRPDAADLKTLTDADDFRREAMEGYAALPEHDHAARLASLRSRLREATPGRKAHIFPMPRIWAAAAALAALVGAVLFFKNQTAEEKMAAATAPQTEVAAESSQPAPPAGSTAVADEIASADKSSRAENQRLRQPDPTLAKPAKPPVQAPADGVAAADMPANETAPMAEKQIADDAATGLAEASEKKEAETRIAAAPASAPPSPQPTRDEQNADFAKSKDLLKNAAGERAKAKPAPTVRHKTDDKPDLKYAKKADEIPAESVPAGGWETFREYLRQNARLPLEAKNNNVSGTVKLQFKVSDDGEATSFAVLKSLPHGCDAEAMRLVKEFEWLPGRNRLVTVDIKFAQ